MREKRIEKEIKKAQKKGIYNPKLKLGIVGLILVIGTVIGVSYAYYTKTATNTLTIEGTVSKRITVEVYSNGNGKVDSLDIATEQTDYGTTATFKVVPNEGYQYKSVSCDNNQSATYNKTTNTLTVTPRTSKDVTCIVEFERVRTLLELANEIKQKAVKELNSNDFANGCPTSGDTACSGVYKMADYSSSTSLNYSNPGGTSYYFRGEVKDNYVKFANRNWRIVRVNGDGTIRLVLDGDIGTSEFNISSMQKQYVGYTYGNNEPCTNANPCTSDFINGVYSSNNIGTSSKIKSFLEEWYKDNLSQYNDKIELGVYCNDTSYGSGSETGILDYGAYQRLRNSSSVKPQLTCPDPEAQEGATEVTEVNGKQYRTYGGVYKLKIGLLSADEIVLAGFERDYYNSPYPTDSNYLYYTPSSSNFFWSSSPLNFDTNYAGVFHGTLNVRYLGAENGSTDYGVRPVINLKANVQISSGDGSADGVGEGPFVIKTN